MALRALLPVAAERRGPAIAKRHRRLGQEERQAEAVPSQVVLEPVLEDVAESTPGAHIGIQT